MATNTRERGRRGGRAKTLDPSPLSPAPALFRDISNFRTPRPPRTTASSSKPPPQSPLYFTASSHLRPSNSKAGRRLRALEIEQSKSFRRVQARKERQLQAFAGSIKSWLNFLFENPGLRPGRGNGKRGILEGSAVGGGWRDWKRQRGDGEGKGVSKVALALLSVSLRDVCGFEDVRERMAAHLSTKACNELLEVLSNVTKSIDNGRLKMKANCPLVTDVGLKDKAVETLMCYNAAWLRIGLYILFGGDSLVKNEEESPENDILLKMIIEKQFLCNADLAKSYAYNKFVEGQYRPGYFEALGSIILKRFLLLALLLDMAKCESYLPLNYGIDGIDGGSPLLFRRQSHIKSSRQLILESLSNSMHGEGDLLAHLSVLGYKVAHQQALLSEYQFNVTELSKDLKDGVFLCRAIQLLQSDGSVLLKLALPTDTHKKKVFNCNIAMQFLELAGVPLCDMDGVQVLAEDILNGDEELTLSLLWNIFVSLQVPLLIDKNILVAEIVKLKCTDASIANCEDGTHMELLLKWIQAICEKYQIKNDNFSSMVDGKAFIYLIDYYLGTELASCSPFKDAESSILAEQSIYFSDLKNNTVQIFSMVQHFVTTVGNFPVILPIRGLRDEDAAYDERIAIILLVFLSSSLLNRQPSVQLDLHKFLQLDNQRPLRKNSSALDSAQKGNTLHCYPEKCALKFDSPLKQDGFHNSKTKEREAIIIQSHSRRYHTQKWYSDNESAIVLLQNVLRAWLVVSRKRSLTGAGFANFDIQPLSEGSIISRLCHRYVRFLTERHQFQRLRKSTVLIQRAVRARIKRRQSNSIPLEVSAPCRSFIIAHSLSAEVEDTEKLEKVVIKLQKVWRKFRSRKFHFQNNLAATIIQSLWRGWMMKRKFIRIRKSVLLIQRAVRAKIKKRQLTRMPLEMIVLDGPSASVSMQTISHDWTASSKSRVMPAHFIMEHTLHEEVEDLENLEKTVIEIPLKVSIPGKSYNIAHSLSAEVEDTEKLAVIKFQKVWMKFRSRKFIFQTHLAATIIQSFWRGWMMRRKYLGLRNSVQLIQRAFRASMKKRQLTSTPLEMIVSGRPSSPVSIQSNAHDWTASSNSRVMPAPLIMNQTLYKEMEDIENLEKAVIKLQKAWRKFRLGRCLLKQHLAAATIQRFWRGWMLRREFLSQIEAATKIQKFIRCLAVKRSFERLRLGAIQIQKVVRGKLIRSRLLGASSRRLGRPSHQAYAPIISNSGCAELEYVVISIRKLQRWWRQTLANNLRASSAIVIQTQTRRWLARRFFFSKIHSIHIIQRWWRYTLSCRKKEKSAIIIQCHFRGYTLRQKANQERRFIVLIQSYFRGYLVRKGLKEPLLDLQHTVSRSSANLNNDTRLINRLVAALSMLPSQKSISRINQTCAALGMATERSQKCCETLVHAGAIAILLNVARCLTRSGPDQEVLKQILSTLNNIVFYPHLAVALVNEPRAVELIFQEFLRNKSEGYFIAYDTLRKLCGMEGGLRAILSLASHLRRLHALVQNLEGKVDRQKRHAHLASANSATELRLQAASDLWQVIMDNHRP